MKTLKLRVLTSRTLNRELPIYITAKGVEGGLRSADDGVSFFGCKKDLNGTVVNDFIIPAEEQTFDLRQTGQHFKIFFSIEEEEYYIRDLGTGFG